MKVKVIYLPGIGDHRPWFQDKLIWLWRLFGLEANFHAVGWANDEAWSSKLEKIISQIDEYAEDGRTVALVGVSAGGSAALNAYVARRHKISAVVFIAGKVKGTVNINPSYFKDNPAFKDSLFSSDAAFSKLTTDDKRRMLYIYTNHDRTVRPEYNRLPGVAEKRILAFSHISAFYLTIIFHPVAISRFIRSRSKLDKGITGS